MVTYSDDNAQPAQPTGTTTYIVTAGDTFWSISHRFGLSVQELMSLNPGVAADKLQVGQSISLVPRSRGRAMFVTFTALPPSTYTIAAGDTFWSIAHRFGLNVAQLTAANPGVDATKLRVGEVIHLGTNHAGKSMLSLIQPKH
jgi:LysM repeat protein